MGQRARAFAKRFFSTESYLNAYRRLFQQATQVRQGSTESSSAKNSSHTI